MLYLRTRLLDSFERWPLDLHPEWGFDSGQLHVQSVLDGHGPGVGETRKLQLGVHLLNELFVGHSRTPLLPRLEHDCGVVHIERRVVRGAVRPSDGSEHGFHFRESTYDAVLFLK